MGESTLIISISMYEAIEGDSKDQVTFLNPHRQQVMGWDLDFDSSESFLSLNFWVICFVLFGWVTRVEFIQQGEIGHQA